MLDSVGDEIPGDDVFAQVDLLKRRIAVLEPARRQALALKMAASLLEEAAYLNASDGARPLTLRLMMWAQHVERTADEVGAAA